MSNGTTNDFTASDDINLLSDYAVSTAKTTAYISCNYGRTFALFVTFATW